MTLSQIEDRLLQVAQKRLALNPDAYNRFDYFRLAGGAIYYAELLKMGPWSALADIDPDAALRYLDIRALEFVDDWVAKNIKPAPPNISPMMPIARTAPAHTPTITAPVVAASKVSKSSAWSLKKCPDKLPGYRWPLYQFLEREHAAGRPRPTAAQALATWKATPPAGLKVVTKGRVELLEFTLFDGSLWRSPKLTHLCSLELTQ